MRNAFYLPALLLLLLTSICTCRTDHSSPFTLTITGQSIKLSEEGKPVLIYRKSPNSLTGRYICNNYIHPLYDLKGNVMTEEFPADHPYHRGVFWAWHQLYADGIRLGDGWTNDSIAQEVSVLGIEKNIDRVKFNLKVSWTSSVYNSGKPFMEERTSIIVHKLESSVRKIDFEISLLSLVRNLRIGGSADPKGYGGFCVRMKTPDSLTFTAEGGKVIPQELQITAGPWMDMSAPFGESDKLSGITIICHPSMPDYPENWILRQKGSMQNVVYPGNGRIDVPEDKPVLLKYRLIVHDGDAKNLNIKALSEEYSASGK